jgi:hypothetical protein
MAKYDMMEKQHQESAKLVAQGKELWDEKDHMSSAMEKLKASGLLRWDDASGQWFTVDDVEEARKQKAKYEEEVAIAQ